MKKSVARSIIPSLDLERYQLPPVQVVNTAHYVPKAVNAFGQESPVLFQPRTREKERAAGSKGANVVQQKVGLLRLLEAGCASLSRPTTTESSFSLFFY